MKRLFGVQYLRGLAATAVIAHHAAFRVGSNFAAGAGGVDVFFIISGFIMWTITQDRRTSPARFLTDRARRIIPLYWIATAVMAIGGAARLFPNMRLTWWHLLGSLLFIPHYSPSDGHIWPLLVPGWTLNYEMFFYALFAASYLLPRSLQLLVLTFCFAVLVLIGTLFHSTNAAFVTYTDAIQLEFLAGVWLGWLWTKRLVAPTKVGIVMVAAGLLGFASSGLFSGNGLRILDLGLPALLLVAGVLSLEAGGLMMESCVLLYVGDGSYSIYLWHGLVISITLKVLAALHLPSSLIYFIAIPGGIVAGLLSYSFLEKPLLHLLKQHKPARAHP